MTRRGPLVRSIDMLSSPAGEPGTTGIFRAMSEADDFCREIDAAHETQVRVDELTQLVKDLNDLHNKVLAFAWDDVWLCDECRVVWPCPTVKLITEAGM